MKRLQLCAACVLAVFVMSLTLGCSGNDNSSVSATAVRSENGKPIEIKLVDTDFEPATIMVKTGEMVTLELVNDGSVKHNFSIADLDVSQDVAAGETETITFTAPTDPGELRIICDEPGHESAGMVGTLVVEE